MLIRHLVPYQPIREWQPLWATAQAPTYYVPFLLIALALPWSRRWKWIDVLVLVVVAYEAVSHIRHIALLSIATLILLPGPLSESLGVLFRNLSRQMAGDHRRWRRTIAVSAVLVSLLGMQVQATRIRWHQGIRPWEIAAEVTQDVPGVPMNAIEFLHRSGVRGNLVTTYGWSQYALWHLYPRVRIAFDGRFRTVYPNSVEQDFLPFQMAMQASVDRDVLLDRYPTDVVLLPRRHPAVNDLNRRPGWVRIHRDRQSVVYIRDLPVHQNVIADTAGALQPRDIAGSWQRFPAGPRDRRFIESAIHGSEAVRKVRFEQNRRNRFTQNHPSIVTTVVSKRSAK